MGYQSDIKAAFYTTHDRAAAMKLYVDENIPEEWSRENFRQISDQHYSGYMFELNGVKWYDSYTDVIAFNRFVSNFLELAEKEEIKWAYEFVRVGEESGDVEEIRSTHADYLVYPNTIIESEFGK